MEKRKINRVDLENDRASLLKEAEEYHRKWLTALGTIDFIDYQLKTFAWEEPVATGSPTRQ